MALQFASAELRNDPELASGICLHCSLLCQFAEQIEEDHLIEGTGIGGCDARVSDDNCQALGSGNGDIDPVPVENEGQSA